MVVFSAGSELPSGKQEAAHSDPVPHTVFPRVPAESTMVLCFGSEHQPIDNREVRPSESSPAETVIPLEQDASIPKSLSDAPSV
jgi:hypothetical protein